MIRLFYNDKYICECCDNDSEVLLDFTEDTMPQNIGIKLYLCKRCKEKLLDILLLF